MATAIQTLVSPGQLQINSVGAATIDGSSTITIGGTTATGVTIGHTGITTAFHGTVTGVANVPSSADDRVVFVNSDSTALTSVSGFGIASDDTLTATKVRAGPGTAAPTIFFEGFTTSGFTRDADTSSIATFVAGVYTNVARTTFSLTDESQNLLFAVSLADGDVFSFILNYSIKCSKTSGDMQCRTGTVHVNMYKLASTMAVGAVQDSGLTSCSEGTLTVDFSALIGGGSLEIVTIRVLPVSSLDAPTITANVNFIIPRGPAAIDWTP